MAGGVTAKSAAVEPMEKNLLKQTLDRVYLTYNRPEFINPDPLWLVLRYIDPAEREVAALIAAFLAYGRVSQIIKTITQLFDRLGQSPRDYLENADQHDIVNDFTSFQYRFTKAEHLISLLLGIKSVIAEYGTLQDCFMKGAAKTDATTIPALCFFIGKLSAKGDTGMLVADPEKRSACKRNHLFLRWMVRSDDVDPGGWESVSRSKLVVPLDTHMHKVGMLLGFTERKQADISAALAVTRGFKRIVPEDPVKYDFCLTRFGIRQEMGMEALHLLMAGKGG